MLYYITYEWELFELKLIIISNQTTPYMKTQEKDEAQSVGTLGASALVRMKSSIAFLEIVYIYEIVMKYLICKFNNYNILT